MLKCPLYKDKSLFYFKTKHSSINYQVIHQVSISHYVTKVIAFRYTKKLQPF